MTTSVTDEFHPQVFFTCPRSRASKRVDFRQIPVGDGTGPAGHEGAEAIGEIGNFARPPTAGKPVKESGCKGVTRPNGVGHLDGVA